MLEAAMVVMTLMGCGDQAVRCDVLEGPKKVWESAAACDAAIPGVLRKSTGAPYPVITARCDAEKAPVAVAKVVAIPEVHFSEKPVQTTDNRKEKSLTGYVMRKTKFGYALVRDGAVGAFDKVRTTASTGYGFVRGGIKTSTRKVVSVTKLSVGYVGDKVIFWK